MPDSFVTLVDKQWIQTRVKARFVSNNCHYVVLAGGDTTHGYLRIEYADTVLLGFSRSTMRVPKKRTTK